MLTKAKINLIKSLDDKKNRDAESLFVVEGTKMAGEVLNSEAVVDTLYYTDDFSFPSDAVGDTTVPCEKISAGDMKRISKLKTPSPVLLLVRKPVYDFDPADMKGEWTLALDGVQDPGNMGTILRLADWFGIGNVVCSADCADIYNDKVIRSTMGAILRVRVHYLSDLAGFLLLASRAGIPVCGTFLDGEPIYEVPFGDEGVVVMGNEGNGISPAVAEAVSHRLFIPPYPVNGKTVESLNVATAAAIVCSEIRRRLIKF